MIHALSDLGCKIMFLVDELASLVFLLLQGKYLLMHSWCFSGAAEYQGHNTQQEGKYRG
jgi:hypothetical protein